MVHFQIVITLCIFPLAGAYSWISFILLVAAIVGFVGNFTMLAIDTYLSRAKADFGQVPQSS